MVYTSRWATTRAEFARDPCATTAFQAILAIDDPSSSRASSVAIASQRGWHIWIVRSYSQKVQDSHKQPSSLNRKSGHGRASGHVSFSRSAVWSTTINLTERVALNSTYRCALLKSGARDSTLHSVWPIILHLTTLQSTWEPLNGESTPPRAM